MGPGAGLEDKPGSNIIAIIVECWEKGHDINIATVAIITFLNKSIEAHNIRVD